MHRISYFVYICTMKFNDPIVTKTLEKHRNDPAYSTPLTKEEEEFIENGCNGGDKKEPTPDFKMVEVKEGEKY